MFNCRQLGIDANDEEIRLLYSDFRVRCDTDVHDKYEALAWAVVVLFSIGVPLAMIVMMVRHMVKHDAVDEGDRFVARRSAAIWGDS